MKVWFDAFALTVGDSLRRSIDRGLAQSRFGIVILSEVFFAKHLPPLELDGLVAVSYTHPGVYKRQGLDAKSPGERSELQAHVQQVYS